ncbi:DNAase [Pelistega indica]|uniref:DNAase n=1 Tax=Pelistega indica TaxID=1414851 RepID=V8G599_9BURK|nr:MULTISPECIES: TatD family hydrolase [Pelistega]ETD71709.1 DNAase [Pelistega indica]
MYIDSHCHLDFPELRENIVQILLDMKNNQVNHALCVSVNLPDWTQLLTMVEQYPVLSASVGVHPDYEDTPELTVEQLLKFAQHPKVVAIGETGLDYYRLSEPLDWQRNRFRTHIQAAIQAQLPLIIHTRNASEDTIRLMREESAEICSGVMHCFTETKEIAQKALDLGFYISLSGIVTFKNAQQVHEVAQYVPLDRLLIETDSPYLAPVPYRGKLNDPSKVIHVAEKIAELRGVTVKEVATQTTENFYRLFSKVSVAQ